MATRRWIGKAVPVKQVSTITVGGTWASTETGTMTINGKEVVVTVGDAATTADVADLLYNAFEDLVANLTTNESYTPVDGGQQISEFKEITATVAASVVTLTADTAGKPFTISVSETSTSGTLTLAEPTAPTGPNHWDNADNWSGDTVPVSTDDVVIDHGDSDIKYGLDASAVTLTSLTITSGFTGNIGLPDINADTSTEKYDEYRDKYLQVSATTLKIGEDDGRGSGRIKLDVGSNQTTALIYGSGTRLEAGVPSILFLGTHASNTINIQRGDLGIAYFESESATVATLKVGHMGNVLADSTVNCGDGTTLTNVDMSGGRVVVDSATTTFDMTGGEATIESAAHAAITVDGGTCYYNSSGTLTTAIVSQGGHLTFERDLQARTVTNCDIFRGAMLSDPDKTVTWSNGIDLNRCAVDEVTINVGQHVRLTPGAVA